jgi:hypothetical protein
MKSGQYSSATLLSGNSMPPLTNVFSTHVWSQDSIQDRLRATIQINLMRQAALTRKQKIWEHVCKNLYRVEYIPHSVCVCVCWVCPCIQYPQWYIPTTGTTSHQATAQSVRQKQRPKTPKKKHKKTEKNRNVRQSNGPKRQTKLSWRALACMYVLVHV